MAKIKKDDVLSYLESSNMLEISELIKDIEDKFNVSAAAPVAVAAAATGGDAGEVAEEKDSFTIVLSEVGDKKINVIKEVRTATGLGLKEAKELVESAPKDIKEDVPKDEANEIKEKLEAAGAKVELK